MNASLEQDLARLVDVPLEFLQNPAFTTLGQAILSQTLRETIRDPAVIQGLGLVKTARQHGVTAEEIKIVLGMLNDLKRLGR